MSRMLLVLFLLPSLIQDRDGPWNSPTENMRGLWSSPLAKSFSKCYGAHRSCSVFPEIKRSNKTGHSLELKNYFKAARLGPGVRRMLMGGSSAPVSAYM